MCTKEAAILCVNRIFKELLLNKPQNEETEPTEDHPMETPMNEIVERNRISEELKNTTQLSQEQLDKLAITMDDFLHALPKVHPCSFFCYP